MKIHPLLNDPCAVLVLRTPLTGLAAGAIAWDDFRQAAARDDRRPEGSPAEADALPPLRHDRIFIPLWVTYRQHAEQSLILHFI